MTYRSIYKALLVAGAVALTGVAAVAYAQSRDPAYAAARSAGQVGEQPDGYLGVVGGGSAEVRAIVNDINIKRKAAYTQSAQSSGSTVEQFAVTSGCNLIAQTRSGEMYKTPSGAWEKRSGPPQRLAACVAN